MKKRILKISESELYTLIKKIINEAEGTNISLGEFPPKVGDFTKSEDSNKIYYSEPTNQIVIEIFKKPLTDYFRVKFIARIPFPNRISPTKQYVNFLDEEVDGKTPGSIDANEIKINEIDVVTRDPQKQRKILYEYQEYLINRSPKFEFFEEFKKLLFKFLSSNPAQFQKTVDLPLPKNAEKFD